MELKKRRFSSPYLDLTRGSKQDCVAGQVYPGQRGREEQLSKREGEMGEQTYLKMKVLVIIVSQRYMLYWTD